MSVHENEYMNQRQVATNFLSAAARLDRDTEVRLYQLYRDYFRRGEEERRWVIWTDIPWDETRLNPAPELVDAVWNAFQEDVFLPDYSARALQILRASRGRTWFLTRWAYEEGKHLLGLTEWLTRSGAMTSEEVRDGSELLLSAFQWEPDSLDGIDLFADFLHWETLETARYEALLAQARDAGDLALVALLTRIVEEDAGHRDFFAESLRIIGETYPDQVAAARRRGEDADGVGGAVVIESTRG